MERFIAFVFFVFLVGCEAIPQEDKVAKSSLVDSKVSASNPLVSIGNTNENNGLVDEAFRNVVFALRKEYLEKIQHALNSLYLSTGEDSTGASFMCYAGEAVTLTDPDNKSAGEISQEEFDKVFSLIEIKVMNCLAENSSSMSLNDFSHFESMLDYPNSNYGVVPCTQDSQCALSFSRNGCGGKLVSSLVHGNESARYDSKISQLIDNVAEKEGIVRPVCSLSSMMRFDSVPRCVKNICVNPSFEDPSL